MTGPDLAAVLAGVLIAMGFVVAIWGVGSADTSWDDAHERRNGDRP